jgi:hypothetical protein
LCGIMRNCRTAPWLMALLQGGVWGGNVPNKCQARVFDLCGIMRNCRTAPWLMALLQGGVWGGNVPNKCQARGHCG